MIKDILKRSSIIAVTFTIFLVGCKYKISPSKPEPTIKKISVESDLSKALGINIIKYEFNLKGFKVPQGKLPYITTWMELMQGEQKIREWSTPNNAVVDSGSILFAYYKPPLFTNNKETLEGKIIIETSAQSKLDISLDMPFRDTAQFGGISEKIIEMDKEYTLVKILEIYSPLGKGVFKTGNSSDHDKTENKALILKVKFGLIEE